jgi:DNA-binding transcriptional regulator YiaG
MYHYTECGLQNVWLVNGYTVHQTKYGDGVSIQDADGLHRAIADLLVHRKPHLTGAEFRYLRKHLEMSQHGLAEMMGVDAQSVARWEKGRVPKMADRYLRFIYRENAEGNAHVRETVERLNELDQHNHERMALRHDRDWRPDLAA